MIFQNQSQHKVEMYSLRTYARSHRLSPHFTLGEMASKDGADALKVHPSLVALLEVIRAHFGKPVIVNSGYRSQSHNRKIGGAPGSKHCLGMAADIRIPGVSPEGVAAFADTHLQAGGVGRYPERGFTHVDVFGFSRRWSE